MDLNVIAKILSIIMSIVLILGVVLIYLEVKKNPCLLCQETTNKTCIELTCKQITLFNGIKIKDCSYYNIIEMSEQKSLP